MSAYRIVTLYSGSGGNSTFICANGTSILIDAGKSAKSLCCALREIGSDISEIDAIFITHEHSDHVSALETLSKHHSIPIHITNDSAKKFDRTPDSPVHANLVRHDVCFCETVGSMTVSSFRTPHDSMMSVGYRIELDCGDAKHTVGLATDIGYVSDSVCEGLFGCEAIVLESNHDVCMLEDGPYPQYLKTRIRSKKGHLDNCNSAHLAARLAENGTKGFILAHLSAKNNLPELVFDEVNSAVSDPSVRICVASPDSPTELFIEEVCT